MIPDLSSLYHASSKDFSKHHPPIPVHSEEWPDEWKTTYYKTYPRLKKIPLLDETPNSNYFELLKSRRTRRGFGTENVSRKDISALLKYSCGENTEICFAPGRNRRAQPSGGARFPIEVYPFIFRGSDIPNGLYHYDVRHHALNVLPSPSTLSDSVKNYFSYAWVEKASAVFLMTSVFWRTKNKYGERGYRYILLEAGHMGQNMYLTAEALGLKCSAMTGTRDLSLESLLDIDGVSESIVYAFVVGK